MLLITAIEQWAGERKYRLAPKNGRYFSVYDRPPKPEEIIQIDFQYNADPTPNIIWVG